MTTTLIQKLGLLRGLLNGEKAYAGPFFVDIDITERCNLHCLGCPYHSSPDRSNRNACDLSLSIFRELCAELQTMGTHSLYLQGPGEPLLHPSLDEVIRLAKGAGFHVMLATNGTLLDEETIRYFISVRLDVLRVSLWAATPEEYLDNYPGVDPANLERVIGNLRLAAHLKRELVSKTPQILLHQPVNQLNFQRLDRLADLASAAGCDGVSFTPVHHHPGAMAPFVLETEQMRKVKVQLHRLRAMMKERPMRDNLDKALRRFDLGISKSSWRPCYAGWLHTHLRVDGSIYPCGHCHVFLGSVCERSFREIWNGPAYRSFRKQIISDAGVFSLDGQSQCNYCCLAAQNARVHGFFRWLLPLVR